MFASEAKGRGFEPHRTHQHLFLKSERGLFYKVIGVDMAKTLKQFVIENVEVMKQWDYEKNAVLNIYPEKIGAGSSKIVWWLCENGHSYEMRVNQRIRGQACPFCSGRRVLEGFNDLARTNPELIEFWDFEKNKRKPTELSHGSHEKVWWKCKKGHTYQQALNKKVSRKSGCPVCSGRRIVAGINDFATAFPEIAKEWHPTKNKDLKPSDISKKSGRKVWWLCANGHEWEATPNDRATYKTGCPICSRSRLTSFPEQAIYYYIKKLYPDAISRYKDIFDNGMELDIYVPSIKFAVEYDGAFWHRGEESRKKERIKYNICRSENITLFRVKENTGKTWPDVADVVYYIRDKKSSRELQMVIQAILDSIDKTSNMWTRKKLSSINSTVLVDIARDEKEILEYLMPIPNSLCELRPDLVEEWHPEKNGNLKPQMFGINSNTRVWWKCTKCNHEWQTSIIHRGGKRQSGCPECAKAKKGKTFTKRRVTERGSLAEKNPALAAEWHPTKNGELTPESITEKRFASVWWLCNVCGHEWEASPNNRSRGIGCPCCSGRVPKKGVNDLKTIYPEIAKEWLVEKNGDLMPEQFLPKSGKKVWWRCSICGYEWETVIRTRSNGHGCPRCNHKKK